MAPRRGKGVAEMPVEDSRVLSDDSHKSGRCELCGCKCWPSYDMASTCDWPAYDDFCTCRLEGELCAATDVFRWATPDRPAAATDFDSLVESLMAVCAGEEPSETNRRVDVLCDSPNGNMFGTERKGSHEQWQDAFDAKRHGLPPSTTMHNHVDVAAPWHGAWEPLCRQCWTTEGGMSVMPTTVDREASTADYNGLMQSLSVCDGEELSETNRMAAVLCDSPHGNTFGTEQRFIPEQCLDALDNGKQRGMPLFTTMHDHVGFAAQWQGAWEPLPRHLLHWFGMSFKENNNRQTLQRHSLAALRGISTSFRCIPSTSVAGWKTATRTLSDGLAALGFVCDPGGVGDRTIEGDWQAAKCHLAGNSGLKNVAFVDTG